MTEFDDSGGLRPDSTSTRWAVDSVWDTATTERTRFGIDVAFEDLSYNVSNFTDY